MTLGEIGRTLKRLDEGQTTLISRFDLLAQIYITRAEHAVITSAQGKDIDELRAELHARRVPWPAVASAIVAIGALSLSVVQLVT